MSSATASLNINNFNYFIEISDRTFFIRYKFTNRLVSVQLLAASSSNVKDFIYFVAHLFLMWNSVILDVECIVCNKTLHKINQNPHELLRKMGKVSNGSITRRSRTPNWSVEEKQYLLELIRERKEVVVTKNNNGPNYSEEKDVAWKEILQGLAMKFGSKFVGFSIKKVKTQWQNMKRIAREEISVHGGDLTRFTKLSLDVCYLLDMIKDGVLVVEAVASTSDPLIATNIEIKTERIDE